MRSPSFVAYLASRFFMAAAGTMVRAGVAWHVFALTHSAFHLGLIGLVQFLPVPVLILVGGALADSYDRRKIMMMAQSVSLLAAVALFSTTHRGVVTPATLYVAIVVISAAGAFDSPSRQALLPSLVPRDIFPRAVTIAATNQALAFTTGPATAGLLIAASGITAVYGAFALFVVASIVTLSFVRPGRRDPGPRRAVSLGAIADGLRFVHRQPVVLGCMTLDMFAVIFGGASALLPIYAEEILRVGPRGFGFLSSSLEAGALVTSIALLFLPPVRRSGRALMAAVGVYGLATIAFGLSRWFPLSLATYALCGVADQVSVVMRATAIQLSTPDELRGRVSAVNMLAINASNQLGAAEAGFVAALTSAPFSVVSGGIGCLAVLAIVATTLPELRRYRTDREPVTSGRGAPSTARAAGPA
jgi:MFS family permease